jgi:bifunctional non-homologous end joining protein LigD
MMAVAADRLPAGDDWTYEVKWDGYRTFAIRDGARVTLLSRNLKHANGQFPSIAAAAARIDVQSIMLDGEIVALDERGRPSFQALQHRTASPLRLAYYAFDLLHLNGRDLIGRRLEERRAELHRLRLPPPLFLSEPLPGTPQEIAVAVRRLDLEGVVAKRRGSTYQPGKRSPAWVKVRFVRRQELVVGGFKPKAGGFDSILVGYYDERGRLCFAGKVRAGLTGFTRAQLVARLRPLETPRCPFANLPSAGTSHWGEGVTAEEMLTLTWVKPRIVVEVAFTEWTRDGSLRHAAFAGLRDDKPPREVRRE